MPIFFRWRPSSLRCQLKTRRTVKTNLLQLELSEHSCSRHKFQQPSTRRSVAAAAAARLHVSPLQLWPCFSLNQGGHSLFYQQKSVVVWDLTSAIQQQLCTDINDNTLTVLLVFSVSLVLSHLCCLTWKILWGAHTGIGLMPEIQSKKKEK